MNVFNKLMLFISSYIPLYMLLILKNIFERITEGGRFVNIIQKFKTATWFDEVNDWAVCILTLAIIGSVFVESFGKWDKSKKVFDYRGV